MSFTPTSNRDLTLWAQLQNDPRIILNSAGVWAGGNGLAKLRFNNFTPNINNPVNPINYKTGRRSKLSGNRGRQGAGFTLTKPFIPSGIAGTPPDDDCLLQAIFGQAPALGATVTYTLNDAVRFLFMAMFNNTPGMVNPTHQYLLGAVPGTIKFTLNQNFLSYTIQGTAVGNGDSTTWPYTGGDALLSGGLNTYPAEPGSFIQNGEAISGFGAGAGVTINGSSLAEMRGNVGITLSLGTEGIVNAMSDSYTAGFVGGLRTASIDQFQCVDSDGSVLKALKTASRFKTLEDVRFQVGTSAGSIVLYHLKNVQFGDMSLQEDGAALDVQFAQSDASATDSQSTDEFSIVIS